MGGPLSGANGWYPIAREWVVPIRRERLVYYRPRDDSALLIAAQSVGALPLANPKSAITNPQSTIAYQGRLADADGNPLTDTVNMIFRLYDVASSGTPL